MNFKEFFLSDESRDVLFIIISIIAVILNFLGLTLNGISFIWIAILFCGLPIIKEAVIGLITEFDIKADVLVSIAIISSIIIGELFAAGVIAIIMAIGGFLEEYTVSKTRSGIEKLVDLSPTKGTLIKNYNEANETEMEISADSIDVGNILKVVPGEVIPVDGIIISGESSIDQSVMTGESIPVDKVIGDEVFSGTINLYGSFIMKAIKKGEDSSLQKLIKLVESANPDNAEVVKSADKWATWIVIIAFLCSIGTWIITGEIIRAVTILVVFCPCALVLATPTAIMASLANLTKVGILVKEGISIEKLAKIDQMIFDKTGTLTYGKPALSKIIPYSNISEKELIFLLASLESPSEHPLAKAIIKYYKDNYNDALDKVSDFEIIVGKGVKAKLNESTLCAGNEEFLKSLNINIPQNFIEESLKTELNQGASAIFIGRSENFLGAVLLSDELREDAAEIIIKLRHLGIGSSLLTGDNENAAKHFAHQVDIVDLEYGCLPEDKISKIRQFQSNDKRVAMMGDGINDAPALAYADIGVALGGKSTDIALESADITITSDEPLKLPDIISLSRKTLHLVRQNFAITIAVNSMALLLGALGKINPLLAATIHNTATVAVVLNSSRLLFEKTGARKTGQTRSGSEAAGEI